VSRTGISGTGPVMPDVLGPDECPRFAPMRGVDIQSTGHHVMMDLREVPAPNLADEPMRRMAMWARVHDETETTAAKLGYLADFVPIAVARTAGVAGAGTSLDNTLRVARLVDCEWVLLDLIPQVAYGSYGHGICDIWSPDGVLMATGSQTTKLFSFESFRARNPSLPNPTQ
jgi:acyl-CoA thioesterase